MYLCCFFFFSFPFGGVLELKMEQYKNWSGNGQWRFLYPLATHVSCSLLTILFLFPRFFLRFTHPPPGWPFVELNG